MSCTRFKIDLKIRHQTLKELHEMKVMFLFLVLYKTLVNHQNLLMNAIVIIGDMKLI
jgi:hypothetical protein